MNSIFTVELGVEFLRAAGIAWLCFLWGIVVFRVHGQSRQGQALARVLILFAPGILTLFGYHSVRQYNVVLAQNRVPFSEVADHGGRVHLTGIDSLTFPGLGRVEWTRAARSGPQTGHRAMLSGGSGSRTANERTPLDLGCPGGCSCEAGGLPCGCTGCECGDGNGHDRGIADAVGQRY
jgi:hypothetical protein